ncbi:MAG: hypothetical protein MR051_02295 [Lentisphaeria bacterium]|nr:hypothetical protein [Lentisphaeria bacterium]
MIFATFGTAAPFPRLLKRLDELAEASGMEFIVQTGTTPMSGRYCRMFDYKASLTEYFERADFVISHAGLGTPMELLRMRKSFIVVPRLARYAEHTNDHQIEISEMLHRKYGVQYFLDVEKISVEMLKNPPEPYPFSDEPLILFHKNIEKVIHGDVGC